MQSAQHPLLSSDFAMVSGIALVTGATGLLGSQVAQAFESRGWKTVGTGLTRATPPSTIKLDLLDSAAIDKALDEIKPSVIVHCAADRSPDSCSTNPTAARALNVSAAATLTSPAAARRIFTLYISTDYVFAGTRGDAPYAPSASTAPPNTYGLTKWEGEGAVLSAARGVTDGESKKRPLAAVLRVPILYGKARKPSDSAVNCLVEAVQRAAALAPGEARVLMDDYALRYPTNTADVGRVCVDVCALYTGRVDTPDAQLLPEVLHFSSEDCMTKLDMCKVLAGILGVGVEALEAFRPAEEELRAEERGERVRRPFDCHLDTKETRALGINCRCVDFAEWWRKELGKE